MEVGADERRCWGGRDSTGVGNCEGKEADRDGCCIWGSERVNAEGGRLFGGTYTTRGPGRSCSGDESLLWLVGGVGYDDGMEGLARDKD